MNNKGVSAVIGVILIVAVTVAIAVTVYVYVDNLLYSDETFIVMDKFIISDNDNNPLFFLVIKQPVNDSIQFYNVNITVYYQYNINSFIDINILKEV
jgi:flagellin-like protein